MKQLILKSLTFLLSGVCSAQTAASSPILDYIRENLPCWGTLKSTDGFVYVDISDAYIHELIKLIQEEGFEEPPYFGRPNLVGAHITLIYPDEVKKYDIKHIHECGMTIPFTPLECQIVHPLNWQEIDGVYSIMVDAPQLTELREKYGLPQRGYGFHITIGVKGKASRV